MPAAPSPPPPDPAPSQSALSGALARIGDRWSLLLVEALMSGPLRFAGLEEAVQGISTNILSARLRHLEAEGVVLAVPYSERPRRYTYELTGAGRDLAGAVRMLAQWSTDHGGAPADAHAGAPIHGPCGTPMVAVWWCGTCEQPGGPDGPQAVWV
jgi:DNA-binding HxlR family transcriptional regulator